MIALKNVSKAYGKMVVLENVTLRIDPGEFVCVTGKSGAGKSTFLHLLTGAEEASKGSITVDNVDLRTVPPAALQIYRRRLGIVFQDYKLIPYRTVAENIAFPLEVCGVADMEIDRRIASLLQELDLVKHKDSLPSHLSGGEKARTAIARAIAHDPMILLADEPTGNLDPDASKQVFEIFGRIHARGTTVVVATHSEELVTALHAREIHLENGSVISDSGPKTITAPKVPSAEKSSSAKGKRKVRVTAIGS